MADRTDWADDALADFPGLLDADEACRALRIHRRKLNSLVADERLRAVRHAEGGSSRLLVTRESVARYLRSIAVV